jgi:hypothetical protein
MKVECCDNCKRPFIRFECSGGEDGYGFVIKEGDVEVLMSDLEFAFCCFTEPIPERENDWQYWCVNCVEAANDHRGDE